MNNQNNPKAGEPRLRAQPHSRHPMEVPAGQLVAPVFALAVAATHPPRVDAPPRRSTLEHVQWAHPLRLGTTGKEKKTNQSISQNTVIYARGPNFVCFA